MRLTSTRFDYSQINSELSGELQDFFAHYNNLIDVLQIILNNGINIQDNLRGDIKTLEVNDSTDVLIDGRARFGTIVSTSNNLDSYKLIRTANGLTINLKTVDKQKTTLTMLVLY